ncbi:MAG: carbon storage regulator [Bryobacterales bacterium]|nr:carbon storage regulator [Bryobacterales bacterium]
MLIIGRRVGETIYLGDDVEIRIMDLSPSRVKIGIVAPRELGILRGEMRQAAAQNVAASQGEGTGLAALVGRLREKGKAAERAMGE